MRKSWMIGTALLMLAGLGLTLGVSAAEDDLAVVKKAVVRTAAADDEADAPRAAAPVRKASRRVTWLKVRVVEQKDGKKEDRVSVTLPLALFAALGKDATVDLNELGVRGLKNVDRHVRVMDLLDSLEPGTVLVEVDDDDAHVRVWVE